MLFTPLRRQLIVYIINSQWFRLFLTFVFVYCLGFPTRATRYFAAMKTVRELFSPRCPCCQRCSVLLLVAHRAHKLFLFFF